MATFIVQGGIKFKGNYILKGLKMKHYKYYAVLLTRESNNAKCADILDVNILIDF